MQRQEPRERIKECFYVHRRRDGSRRSAAELRLGRFRGRATLRAEGLRAMVPRAFKPRPTDSRHDARISPNLLTEADAAPQLPGAVIVGDITYLPLRGGRFGYLASFQDKYPRRIVGWEVSAALTADLVVNA